jgi:small subunit ribosomal protein S13
MARIAGVNIPTN